MPPAAPSAEWLQRCVYRLRRQWPSIPTDDLEETARDLFADERWRSMAPEAAAVEWLKLGVLASG